MSTNRTSFREVDAFEAFELDKRSFYIGFRVTQIQLDDLIAVAVAGVRDVRGHDHAALRREGIDDAGAGIRE